MAHLVAVGDDGHLGGVLRNLSRSLSIRSANLSYPSAISTQVLACSLSSGSSAALCRHAAQGTWGDPEPVLTGVALAALELDPVAKVAALRTDPGGGLAAALASLGASLLSRRAS